MSSSLIAIDQTGSHLDDLIYLQNGLTIPTPILKVISQLNAVQEVDVDCLGYTWIQILGLHCDSREEDLLGMHKR